MALTELEELNIREKLDSGGLSELEELNLRERLETSIGAEPIPAGAEAKPSPADLTQQTEAPAPATTQQAQASVREPATQTQPGVTQAASLAPDPSAEQRIVNTLDKIIIGGLETVAALGSGALAQIPVGLAAIGKGGSEALFGDLEIFGEGVTSPESVEAGGRVRETMQQVEEAFTFQPRTPEGQAAVNAVGQVIGPIIETVTAPFKFLADKTFERTKSPALSALVESVPEVALELVGFKGGKLLAKRKKQKTIEKQIVKELDEATPTIDQLFNTSREVYREIDESGITVKPEEFKKLVIGLKKEAGENGLDVATASPQDSLTPRANRVLNVFDEALEAIDAGEPLTLTRLDQLRKIAKTGADTLNGTDKSLNIGIIDSLDQFLDEAGTNVLQGRPSAVKEISNKYKDARGLWGRARRSQLLQNALENARNGATGFDNSVRNEFRKILRNKKQRRYFNDVEISEMQKVVNGSKGANIAKLIGKLGFTDGKTSNVVGGTIGFLAGKATGIPWAEVIVPTIGFMSKRLANRLTRNNAIMADRIIRAGKDAEKITDAYIRSTPKNLRRPEELSQLLMRPDINLTNVGESVLAREAVIIARQDRIRAGIIVGGASLAESQRNEPPGTISLQAEEGVQ